MTISEEIKEASPFLDSYYRIEQGRFKNTCEYNRDFAYFNENNDGYIYISKSQKHHMYFTSKRIKDIIVRSILGSSGNLNPLVILNSKSFKHIVKLIENYEYQEQLISIEFNTSPIFKEILKNNVVHNMHKQKDDGDKIEAVDLTRYHGGYGLTKEYLRIFQIMSYFSCYQRITKENLIEYLFYLREYYISGNSSNNLAFLTKENNRNCRINHTLYEEFTKYELLECIEAIIDKKIYFPSSSFALCPIEFEKKILNQYEKERKKLLQLSEEAYSKRLKL